jgi:hypothetical protein
LAMDRFLLEHIRCAFLLSHRVRRQLLLSRNREAPCASWMPLGLADETTIPIS